MLYMIYIPLPASTWYACMYICIYVYMHVCMYVWDQTHRVTNCDIWQRREIIVDTRLWSGEIKRGWDLNNLGNNEEYFLKWGRATHWWAVPLFQVLHAKMSGHFDWLLTGRVKDISSRSLGISLKMLCFLFNLFLYAVSKIQYADGRGQMPEAKLVTSLDLCHSGILHKGCHNNNNNMTITITRQ